MVFVMREQLPLSCQTHGVYTVWLKYDDGQVSRDRYDHQGTNSAYPPVSSAIRNTPVRGA